MALPDVLGAKKTQRDKDWPMIRRLVEANYAQHHQNPTDKQIQFWLLESRTPAMLIEVAKNYPDAANRAIAQRPLLTDAISGNRSSLQRSLAEEMETEREADREYWRPLKRELEQLRRERR